MNHHIKNLNLAKELTCKTQFLQHVPSSNYLKLVSTIFYQIFIFSPNDSPSKTMKNVFFIVFERLSLGEKYKFDKK